MATKTNLKKGLEDLQTQRFKNAMQEGEYYREKEGHFAAAHIAFESAIMYASTLERKLQAYLQLALTYIHFKDYESAWTCLRLILEQEEKGVGVAPGILAETYRHMSRSEITHDLEDSYEYATKAMEFAEKAKRKDLIWFVHGVFRVAFKRYLQSMEIGHRVEAVILLHKEEELLRELESSGNNVGRENDVWLVWKTGYYMDKALMHKDFRILDEALEIAQNANLVLRVAQIKKLRSLLLVTTMFPFLRVWLLRRFLP